MKTFSDVAFRGEFRSYQQAVLAEANEYMSDGKIHVVAAPGSGKTILGLELMRTLGVPALVLSPTVTIRSQWCARFEEWFLPPDDAPEAYLSQDLRQPSLITSVTYQALHAAWTRAALVADEDTGETAQADFGGFDLLETVRAAGIGVLCLDEAHHLRSEWQKALEGFLEALGGEIRIVSLTATPPYDSEAAEWKRYLNVCGDIDCEIYVPELVKQGTLCPHQDYIYFNYPTAAEFETITEFRQRVSSCLTEILHEGILDRILESSRILSDFNDGLETYLDYATDFAALLSMAAYRGVRVPGRQIRLLCARRKLPDFDYTLAQRVFQFVLDQPALFSEGVTEELDRTLRRAELMDRKKVRLVGSEAVTKALMSSAGKLDSIAKIAREESDTMGERLRMLVLTDYIRRELLDAVGTDTPINTMGTVPAFETIRRALGDRDDLALLTGTLVLWPSGKVEALRGIAAGKGVRFSARALERTPYSVLEFGGDNRNKVEVITEAFQQGMVRILVGTKALLGEGWDSPCINSLILASFVGSFVLSNQMRGRAIRSLSGEPDKIANIWHLVTLEPKLVVKDGEAKRLQSALYHDDREIVSEDYETLKRRFHCFFAPAYSIDIIANGIERVDIIKPPFDRKGIERINAQMVRLAADRKKMAKRWHSVLDRVDNPQVLDVSELPKTALPRGFLFLNLLKAGIWASILAAIFSLVFGVGEALIQTDRWLLIILILAIGIVGMIQLGKVLRIVLLHRSPAATVRAMADAMVDTLRDIGEIHSADVAAHVEADPEIGQSLLCSLNGGTTREKALFAKAIGELLSAIDNPRYVLIRKNRFFRVSWLRYRESYACPAVIGTKKAGVEQFSQHLARRNGKFELFYTRHEKGMRVLRACRRQSYVNRNENYIQRLLMVG